MIAPFPTVPAPHSCPPTPSLLAEGGPRVPPWLSLPPIPLLAVLTEPALSAHQVEQASGEGRKEGQGHLAHSLRTIKTFISFNLIIPPRGIASKEEKKYMDCL